MFFSLRQVRTKPERERRKKFLSMLSCPSGRKSKSEFCSYREKGLCETLGYDWGAFRDTLPDEGGMRTMKGE